jgi:hypothetical protein
MEASTEAHLLHLRSLRYDDYFWDGDVPVGYGGCAGGDCRGGQSAGDNPDSVHCVCYT